METVCSSETFLSTYKSTRRYNPEDQHRQPPGTFRPLSACTCLFHGLQNLTLFSNVFVNKRQSVHEHNTSVNGNSTLESFCFVCRLLILIHDLAMWDSNKNCPECGAK
jgi:hypothetical protein